MLIVRSGKFTGENGISREKEILVDAHATLLSKRRGFPPYGLSGGCPDSVGENLLINGRNVRALLGKGKSMLQRGDQLVIKTTIGGGGYGMDC